VSTPPDPSQTQVTPPRSFRVGQIVPSSNVTMETEIPQMLRWREALGQERFTCHSSRMRMKHVSKDELEAMDKESLRCAAELSDARVDVMGYACLVAIMSMGLSYHRQAAERLGGVVAAEGSNAPVVTSAGALVSGIHALKLRRVAMLMPYMRPLAELVVRYLEHEGIEVVSWHAFEIANNLAVGARDPSSLVRDCRALDLRRADGIVISACVQMPSLAAIPGAEREYSLPVVSAATCTVREMLLALGLTARVPYSGAALSG
jgi:maleate isomerase